jgi:small subunit ribosomal protein S6
MRKYELMTIYPVQDDKYKAGLENVKNVLSQFGAEIQSEESYGDRDLCYEVKKQKKGRFLLLNITANPAKIDEIDRQFKLNADLLKFLFVRVED